MTKAELLAMKKVKGIEIGKVTNIFYDKGTDVIVIIERNDFDSKSGPHKYHFGANAPELRELLETLREFYIETLNDKLDIFKIIWERLEE